MEVFESKPPSYSEAELLEIVKDYYGMTGTIKMLVSERDQNAKIITNDGEYVLKVANEAEDHAFLEFQNAVMNHVAEMDSSIPLPKVIKGVGGTEIFQHDGNDIRLITFLDGEIFNSAPKSEALYQNLGSFLGKLSKALRGFGHPAAHQPNFLWNLDNALYCKQYITDIEDDENRALVQYYFDRYEEKVAPRLNKMRSAVLYSDANDYNMVVKDNKISGIFDFGDMVYGTQINELAIAIAYAILDVDDFYLVVESMIKSYVAEFALEEEELDVLFDLVAMRLAKSVCISSNRVAKAADEKHKEYLLITQKPAFNALRRIKEIGLSYLSCYARKTGGYTSSAKLDPILKSIENADKASLFDFDMDREGRVLLQLSKGGKDSDNLTDPDKHWDHVKERMAAEDALFAIGRYGEDKNTLAFDDIKGKGNNEYRTVHLGLDFWVEPGTNVNTPLAGVVHSIKNNNAKYDFGHTVILKHKLSDDAPEFYSLIGHLSAETMNTVKEGQELKAGDKVGTVGTPAENGHWSPHVHYQIMTDLLDNAHGEFPGGCEQATWDTWQDICPNPNAVIGLINESYEENTTTIAEMMNERRQVLAPSLSVAYKKHLHIVRGKGAYLYDSSGRAFLDSVNNITHVGHCNPHVVNAISKQAERLNTNSRYLYEGINKLAARILKTMPDPLSVMFFTNSGSEANELALRLARHYTGRNTTVAVDWGYHGNTNATVAISAYKFNRKGGNGCPPETRLTEFPDPYQGRFNDYSEASGKGYAEDVDNQIADLIEKTGEGPAAFIAESIAGVGGQVVYPDGYLKAVYEKIRAAGGLCIADEVQTGIGRTGEWWAYLHQGVVPDIVSFGKPFGNGHPMAAVVTTREIADRFANGMEYFNSFGGNPVSCAIGMAVLDVVEGEGLREKGVETGNYIMDGMTDMMDRYDIIGQVRGKGMFFGAEVVKDRDTKERAPEEASRIVQYMREEGVLFSTDGPYDNVLKGKPPMVFGMPEADIFLEKLENAFKRLYKEGF